MGRDLTTGSIFGNVVRFSLPYLLSYFLQTLYGMADLFIIGQYAGVEATTAVSVGSQVMHMLTVMIVGLAMGTTVSIEQAIGAKDRARASAATGNTAALFLPLSVLLAGVLLLLRGAIVSVMATPAQARAGSICAGTSGTAFLPASSSASAATSAPAGAPGCRSCTTFCPLSASASPAHIPPRGCFRRRVCRRAISRSTTACFLRLTRRMCLKAT